MTAALGGIDLLVFTGTVGECSDTIRERVVYNLHYLDFFLDTPANKQAITSDAVVCISRLAHSRPIYVIPVDETAEMVHRLNAQ